MDINGRSHLGKESVWIRVEPEDPGKGLVRGRAHYKPGKTQEIVQKKSMLVPPNKKICGGLSGILR